MEEQSNLSPEQNQEEQPRKQPNKGFSTSFDGLPLEYLIGGPLRAAAEAQQKQVNNTEEFLKKIASQQKSN